MNGAGPLPRPATQRQYSMGGRAEERAGAVQDKESLYRPSYIRLMRAMSLSRWSRDAEAYNVLAVGAAVEIGI